MQNHHVGFRIRGFMGLSHTLSERKKRAVEALSYNALLQRWPEIARLARETAPYPSAPAQADLL